MIIFIAF